MKGAARTFTLLPGLLLAPMNGNADPAQDRDWQLYHRNHQQQTAVPLPSKSDELRLAELERALANQTLTAQEEAELIVLLAKVKGIYVRKLSDLANPIQLSIQKLPIQKIIDKFPEEALPIDGKIIPYSINNGAIKGINGRRQFDFIVNSNGNLVIGSKHHMLGNRQDVQAAGQLRLNGQGKIRQIDNLSGHYQPTVAETTNYPEILRRAGLDVKGVTITTHGMDINSDGMITGIKVASSKVIK